MADYSVLSDISNRAKEMLQNLSDLYFFDENSPRLYNRFMKESAGTPKITERGYDNKYILPYRTAIPMGFIPAGEAVTLPPPGKETVSRMTTSLKTFKGRVQDTWEKLDSETDDRGWVARKTTDIVKDCLMSADHSMTLFMYGYEYKNTTSPSGDYYLPGILGQVASWDNTNKKVTVKAPTSYYGEPGLKYIMIGQRVLFGSLSEITGGTVPTATEALVSAMDPDNNTFTITDTDGTTFSGTVPAANEFICLGYVATSTYLGYNYAPVCLLEHIGQSTVANYQGVSRSGNPFIQGIVKHNSNNAQALTEDLLRQMLVASWNLTKKEAAKGRLLVCDKNFELKYRALFDSLFIYSTDGRINKAKVFSDAPQIDGVTPFIDQFCPTGQCLCIDPEAFLLIAPFGGTTVKFEDSTGTIFNLLGSNADADIFEVRYRTRWQIMGRNPPMNTRLRDIITSG
jgi:hypothetical protein